MNDFSVQAAQIVESVRNAMYDMTEFARETRDHARSEDPTPFQRAVIGGLVIIGYAVQSAAHTAQDVAGERSADPVSNFSSQEVDAAHRAIAPFLDETSRPA